MRLSIFKLKTAFLTLIALIAGINGLTAQNSEERTVALFSYGYENDRFWNSLSEVTEAAGNDLNLNIEVYTSDGTSDWLGEALQKVTSRSDKPDAVIFPVLETEGVEHLEIIEENDVPAVTINSGVNTDMTGEPGEEYENWIAQLTPDDIEAGYKLARRLIVAAKENLDKDTIKMYAVGGVEQNKPTQDRLRGMQMAIDQASGVELVGTDYTDWSGSEARERTTAALDENPDIDIFWTASDNMALAVSKLVQQEGRTINDDAFVGGIDWLTSAIDAVSNNQLTATVGGHVIEGGWASVLLYDYFKGVNVTQEAGMMQTPMTVIDDSNVGEYEGIFGSNNWGKINFTLYTRSQNTSLDEYKFTLETMIIQMR